MQTLYLANRIYLNIIILEQMTDLVVLYDLMIYYHYIGIFHAISNCHFILWRWMESIWISFRYYFAINFK